jgi:hypothetical protein
LILKFQRIKRLLWISSSLISCSDSTGTLTYS